MDCLLPTNRHVKEFHKCLLALVLLCLTLTSPAHALNHCEVSLTHLRPTEPNLDFAYSVLSVDVDSVSDLSEADILEVLADHGSFTDAEHFVKMNFDRDSTKRSLIKDLAVGATHFFFAATSFGLSMFFFGAGLEFVLTDPKILWGPIPKPAALGIVILIGSAFAASTIDLGVDGARRIAGAAPNPWKFESKMNGQIYLIVPKRHKKGVLRELGKRGFVPGPKTK